MLFNLFSGVFDSPIQIVTYLFSTAFVIFCTMPIHEFAHAWVATKLGDQTPRLSGRLSLNPMAHISVRRADDFALRFRLCEACQCKSSQL